MVKKYQLTKQERHDIYKEALVLFSTGKYTGLCVLLCLSMADIDKPINPEQLVANNILPEFNRYQPFDMDEWLLPRSYWWPTEDKLSRINALEECVRLTA